jgi:hypothetical protein
VAEICGHCRNMFVSNGTRSAGEDRTTLALSGVGLVGSDGASAITSNPLDDEPLQGRIFT